MPASVERMSHSLLCVQFKNLLPSEDLLWFARTLWETAQRDRWGAVPARDATLSITKTESKAAPFEASLALAEGTPRSVATGLDALAVIEAAFAQVQSPEPHRALRAVDWSGETASGEAASDAVSA